MQFKSDLGKKLALFNGFGGILGDKAKVDTGQDVTLAGIGRPRNDIESRGEDNFPGPVSALKLKSS